MAGNKVKVPYELIPDYPRGFRVEEGALEEDY